MFEIKFFHAWFQSGIMENCNISADADTAKYLKRYRLLANMERGVFGLYSSSKQSIAGLLQALVAQLDGKPLRFALNCSVDTFFFISDMPLNWCGKLLFSSKNVLKNEVNGSFSLLSQFPAVADGGVRQGFVTNDGTSGQAVAEILIYPDDLLRIGNAVSYQIQFQARSLAWKYYLISRNKKKLYNPTIIGQDGTKFNTPTPVLLPGGETALCFSSGDLKFPLQQFPVQRFNLIDYLPALLQDNQATIECCLIKGLPTPQRKQLTTGNALGGQDVFSAMYIYL